MWVERLKKVFKNNSLLKYTIQPLLMALILTFFIILSPYLYIKTKKSNDPISIKDAIIVSLISIGITLIAGIYPLISYLYSSSELYTTIIITIIIKYIICYIFFIIASISLDYEKTHLTKDEIRDYKLRKLL